MSDWYTYLSLKNTLDKDEEEEDEEEEGEGLMTSSEWCSVGQRKQ